LILYILNPYSATLFSKGIAIIFKWKTLKSLLFERSTENINIAPSPEEKSLKLTN
jgi:hypothetical protein